MQPQMQEQTEEVKARNGWTEDQQQQVYEPHNNNSQSSDEEQKQFAPFANQPIPEA